MEIAPVQYIMSTLTQDYENSPETDTLADRIQKFAEEASFFFKERPLRPMPDQPLLLILYKSKLRRKKRKVSKKDKLNKFYMRKRKSEEQDNHPDSDTYEQSI
ncbi:MULTISPECIES: hypothetical protein [unclassified Endozoicomonas]|uniref:hypothetical protein n=1 Tax=unclassified Endozoicomonas TaxID=2644528 RepID=UPI00214970FA|nr:MULTISPECIES: hypothetical protein [unclassified Endozoicomonas]